LAPQGITEIKKIVVWNGTRNCGRKIEAIRRAQKFVCITACPMNRRWWWRWWNRWSWLTRLGRKVQMLQERQVKEKWRRDRAGCRSLESGGFVCHDRTGCRGRGLHGFSAAAEGMVRFSAAAAEDGECGWG
jgi:hypothetical protein